MPSKELIEKVARAIMHDENTYRVGGEEYCETVARIAIATIRAALQEPTEIMLQAYWDGSEASDSWGLMLAASVLGEQSE
ncbi:hypothetical protein F9K88_07725 [Brucella intermedia]|uniref:hypothetical protein n=1 Tax=Brucella intermedia TaxID=94625 RepID=UPI00124F0E06|nr:hypothetical protein [Brucella intermedia]KAB2712837.1 hypothetical protein F9K88_07725 [Brucella intermedia]